MKFTDSGNFLRIELMPAISPDLSSVASCSSVADIVNCLANRFNRLLFLSSSALSASSPSGVIISGYRARKACLL